MKLQFLGTAAAEGFPSFYCKCDACKEAMSKGGRNIRSRCQSLLDDTILLDFGPDTYYHMVTYKVPLESIHHILITHNHADHFQTDDLYYRREGYAAVIEEEPLYVYGTKPVYDRVNETASKERFVNVLKAVEITPFVPFKVKEYDIMPLKASHALISGPVLYLISKDNKTMLYAHDTGLFCKETWDELEKLEKPLDLITLDCTAGILIGWDLTHLSFDVFLRVIDEMKEKNIVDDHTIVIANHFSHNGKATYDKMVEVAKEHNVIISYDGMVVEF